MPGWAGSADTVEVGGAESRLNVSTVAFLLGHPMEKNGHFLAQR